MTFTNYDIAYLFFEIITLYSIKMFYGIFFHIKKGFTYFAAAAYFAYFAITVTLNFFVSVPIINLFSNIILLFLISLCYEATLRRRLVAMVECLFIMFASEAFISTVTKNVYIDLIRKYEYENILGLFFSRMIIFFLVLLISKLIDVRKNKDLPYRLNLTVLSVPIITMIIELMISSINGATFGLVIISMVLMFVINVIALFLFNSLSKFYVHSLELVKTEQEREYYQYQCTLMQNATDDIRSFQHDISNHFMIIEDMLKNEKEKEAFAYILELVNSEKTVPVIYSATGNIAVDSIINYKLCRAALNDIEVKVDIIIPKELPVEIMDLSAILTNLLDNALQALQRLKENKKLNIKILYKKGILLIRIQNTYNGIVKYENGEIVTTKESPDKHGYGMKNVETAAEKYDGVCQVTHDDNVFMSEVLLYCLSDDF